jgi:hypothetical protein
MGCSDKAAAMEEPEMREVGVEELHKLMGHHKVFREIKAERADLERISETRWGGRGVSAE